jgi:hypothetical protein
VTKLETTLPLLGACLALALGACAAMTPTAASIAPSATEHADEAAHGPASASGSDGASNVLYARDGSVVSTEPAGAARSETGKADATRPETNPRNGGEPARDLGDHPGSRVYMLELYQKALEDKGALALQVQALEAELERARAACNDGDKVRDGLRSQMDALMKERDQLRAETLDLATRLTTTQLRRLEAEKKLLELQIDGQRRADADAAPRESIKPPSKSKKSPGDKP